MYVDALRGIALDAMGLVHCVRHIHVGPARVVLPPFGNRPADLPLGLGGITDGRSGGRFQAGIDQLVIAVVRGWNAASIRACFGLDKITDREARILQALYDAELRYLDDKLREFDAFLRDEGVRENTIFLVVSDHGDFFGKTGLWGHQGRVYNDVCHVPLIVD